MNLRNDKTIDENKSEMQHGREMIVGGEKKGHWNAAAACFPESEDFMWMVEKGKKSIICELLLVSHHPLWEMSIFKRCFADYYGILMRKTTVGVKLHAHKWLFTHHNRLSCAKNEQS